MHPLAEFECDDLPTKVPVITPSPMPFPSYTPTGTWSPMTPLTTYPPTTTRPTRSLVMPYTGKTPDWVDVDGHGCEWWQVNDLPGYPLYGDEYEGTMGVANENCCYFTRTVISRGGTSKITRKIVSQNVLKKL